jgi:ribosome maturation factor RimP
MQQTQLELTITPAIKACGCQLWGLEFFPSGRRSVLRVYIDTQTGVDIEQCATVSRQISSVLDVADLISGEYTLEVSSPGLDRPLFTLSQYEQSIGVVINLRLRAPFEGRRNFKGLLASVDIDKVILQLGQDEYELPFESIEKANIVPQF